MLLNSHVETNAVATIEIPHRANGKPLFVPLTTGSGRYQTNQHSPRARLATVASN
jgi:hypothetical protein